MKQTFRQSMGWLHTWAGLWLGWVLVVIFMTGTLAVFAGPITHWMQPELMAHEREEAAELMNLPRALPISERVAAMDRAIREGRNWATMWWTIELDHIPGADRYYWWDSNRGDVLPDGKQRGALGALELLDSATASKPVENEHEHPTVRDTAGGHFFVTLHYSLTHDGDRWGLYTVFVATIIFLVALVSGVVVHKKIFADFFTFRRGKGQRSWLDAHNALAVMTLPFLLMIGWSGLDLLEKFEVPSPARFVQDAESSDQQPLFEPENRPLMENDAIQPLTPLAPLVEKIAAKNVRIVGLSGRDINTARPTITVRAAPLHDGRFVPRTFVFDGHSGAFLGEEPSTDAGAVRNTLRQLHMADLHNVLPSRQDTAQISYRWLLFMSSALGTGMMAAGVVLFIVKRRKRALGEFGRATPYAYRGIEALNVAAIAGLAIACVGYLWLNRLVPMELPTGWDERHHVEQDGFLYLWIATLIHALLRKPMRAWFEQLALLSLLCLALPLVNWATTGEMAFHYLGAGDWEAAGVELTAIAFGLLAAFAAFKVKAKINVAPIERRRRKAPTSPTTTEEPRAVISEVPA